jgi:sirohydrochlorin cobaltochelatase
MRRLYPGVLTLVSTVEGYPPLDETLAELRRQEIRRVVLKPLLLVAGEHALRDLAGPGEDSWRSILERQAIEVVPVLSGLGEEPAFARIFVDHAAEAAADASLELR